MGKGTGGMGEDYAARLLEKKGYGIVQRNYRSRFGEIDIIARNAQYIVFTEVKTRDENHLAGPLESVTGAKRAKIVKTALFYLQSHPVKLQPRFDVIGITTADGGRSVRDVVHIENAFEGREF